MNKNLVVFDLNGVLIERKYIGNRKNADVLNKYSKRIGNTIVSKIDNVDCNELGKYYDIAVWSSMSLHNINKYIDYIFGDFT